MFDFGTEQINELHFSVLHASACFLEYYEHVATLLEQFATNKSADSVRKYADICYLLTNNKIAEVSESAKLHYQNIWENLTRAWVRWRRRCSA